jgi:hypothetical protein
VHRQLQFDPALIGGVYANLLAIWHTGDEFTLDFAVNAAPASRDRMPDGREVIAVNHKVVARVRIPPGAAFEFIRLLNENMTLYEQQFGPIKRPGQDQESPLYPPPDLGAPGGEAAA